MTFSYVYKAYFSNIFKKEASYTLRMTLSDILICLQSLSFKKNSPPAVLEENKLHTKDDCDCHSHSFTRPIFQKFSPPAVLEEGKFRTKND